MKSFHLLDAFYAFTVLALVIIGAGNVVKMMAEEELCTLFRGTITLARPLEINPRQKLTSTNVSATCYVVMYEYL